MMRGHWSLARSLLAVGLIALGLGFVRTATPSLARTALYVTYGILVVAGVGAAVRGRHHGAWRGFAIVGWAYFLPVFAFGSRDLVTDLPTNTALAAYVSRVRPRPVPPSGFGIVEMDSATISYSFRGPEPPVSFRQLLLEYNRASRTSMQAGHLLLTLLLAYLGSILGDRMSRRRPGGRVGPKSPRKWDQLAGGSQPLEVQSMSEDPESPAVGRR